MTVVQELDSGKPKRTGIGDEKRQLVDVHDVDGQMNVAMSGKNVMWDQSDVTNNMRRGMICCLAFEQTEVWTKDGFGRLNMLFVDGAVVNVVDGDVHEFSATRTHDDVLHMSRKNGIFVLSFSELLGISCHS